MLACEDSYGRRKQRLKFNTNPPLAAYVIPTIHSVRECRTGSHQICIRTPKQSQKGVEYLGPTNFSSLNGDSEMKFISVLFFALLSCVCQAATACAQTADSQGGQILERAIAAAGGRQLWGEIRNFRASGKFSLYSNGDVMQTGTAELLGAGVKKFRLAATLGNETRTWFWKDGSGALATGNGSTEPIGRHNLAVLESSTLPIQKVIALLDGPSRSVQFIESTDVNGRPSYRVRIARTASSRNDEAALGRQTVVTDVLIDQQTLAILSVEDTLHPNGNTRDSFQHRLTYSDYRAVAGVLVPFSIKEEISQQLTWGLQLDSFEPNSGVSDSQFELK
jgi:hypothetical protein